MILQKPCHPKMIHGKMGEVLSVYTLPAYRRQGIAQHNMQRLVDYARANGLDYVNLSATKAGYPVYQKVGFSERQSHYTEMQIR